MAFSAIKSVSFTTEELNFLEDVLGLMYREGGAASPRPEGWTKDEWFMRADLSHRIALARREARDLERKVKDECGCITCSPPPARPGWLYAK